MEIDGHNLLLSELEAVVRRGAEVVLSPGAVEQITASRAVVDEALNSGKAIYGITTGFGKFKEIFIPPEDSRVLQRNLILSHAAGVGPTFEYEVSRAALLLRANALAKGFSGVRLQLVQLLLDCLNAKVHPLIPEQGSLGASGDLAPLAHLALVLIGEGTAEYKGELLPGREALKRAGLEPLVLEAKEGLALTNGTQIMQSMGCLLLLEAENLSKAADIIGALTTEALLGTNRAFLEKIHRIRPHAGQMQSATNLNRLLADSAIMVSHRDCPMVQDAYSIRCMPQVHGASRQAFHHAREVFEIEMNSATDNPLVFSDEILSGGNFHGQPLALALDYVSIALAELANISERRTERLVNPSLSNGLPAFLTTNGGLESGFMIAQYTAAALVSENKVLAHPASVDSIPTSANQEDHVSMGATAGRKARMILKNTRKVLAIEMLCATQGIEYRICPDLLSGTEFPQDELLLPGPGIYAAFKLVRKHIARMTGDRELHLDMNRAEKILESNELVQVVEQAVGRLS